MVLASNSEQSRPLPRPEGLWAKWRGWLFRLAEAEWLRNRFLCQLSKEQSMRLLAISQQVLTGRGVRLFASALSVLVLAAVPALGITRLGADALSSWALPGPDQVAGLSAGPLTFEAPSTVLAGYQTAEEAHRALAKANQEGVTELTDWTFTLTAAQNNVLAAFLFTGAFDFNASVGLFATGITTDQFADIAALPLLIQLDNLQKAAQAAGLTDLAGKLSFQLNVVFTALNSGQFSKFQIVQFMISSIFDDATAAAVLLQTGGATTAATLPINPFASP